MLQRSSWIAQQEKKVCGGGKGGQEKKVWGLFSLFDGSLS